MRSRIFTLLVVIGLTGCSGSILPNGSPGQRLYAADGGYRALLELAVAYAEACRARPAAEQGRCGPVVAKLQEIDRRYAGIRDRIDVAGPSDADIVLVEAVLAELRRTLAAEQSGGAG